VDVYRKIVLALDASAQGSLISATAAVAARNKAEVLVLHVTRAAEQNGRAVAETACRQLRDRSIEAEPRTLSNSEDAGVLIAKAAQSFGADLIIMGSRGLGELRAAYAGSVSRQVIIRTDCPVLLIKDGSAAMKPPAEAGRVLAAVESTEDVETIVPALLGLATPADVIVLNVPELIRTFGEPEMRVDFDSEAETVLLATVHKLREAGISATGRVAANVAVDVARAIAREASGCEADLIVVGSRRPGTLEGILIGSTARGVLQHADRPVLIAGRPGDISAT
jgi:nucleotide-binding universal stress UspA family protein